MYNLNDIFLYKNGQLFWKVKPAKGRHIGDLVGTPATGGYLRLQYKGVPYFVHRVVWEMHNGPIPSGMQVDHVNHNKTDNRLSNLRLVTSATNHKNRGKHSKNTSGVTGVCWCKRSNKWLASITVNGKRIHLGLFIHLLDATTARNKAELLYNFHKNHGK